MKPYSPSRWRGPSGRRSRRSGRGKLQVRLAVALRSFPTTKDQVLPLALEPLGADFDAVERDPSFSTYMFAVGSMTTHLRYWLDQISVDVCSGAPAPDNPCGGAARGCGPTQPRAGGGRAISRAIVRAEEGLPSSMPFRNLEGALRVRGGPSELLNWKWVQSRRRTCLSNSSFRTRRRRRACISRGALSAWCRPRRT